MEKEQREQVVREALARVKNVNDGVDIESIFSEINGSADMPILTRESIRRTMKNMPVARKIDKDTWKVRGRATPKKV